MIRVARLASQASDGSEHEVVLGVDTHAETHTAAVITIDGVLLGIGRFPTTSVGYEQLLGWARGHGDLDPVSRTRQ